METTKQILEKIDIVKVAQHYLELTKKGNNYWGLCPFHEDKNPSFSVSPQKQFAKCFVCGEGGNAIDLVMKLEKVEFTSALKILRDKLNIKIEVYEKPEDENLKKLKLVHKELTAFFQFILKNTGNQAIKNYIKKRQLDEQTINTFKVGFCPDTETIIKFAKSKQITEEMLIEAQIISNSGNNWNCIFANRLVFPISNEQDHVVGFSARLIDGIDGHGPKYINSPESPIFKKSQILYNFNNSQSAIKKSKEVIVCEGFMDVIALYKKRVTNTIALMGVNLSSSHYRSLTGVKTMILSLDNDEAGRIATKLVLKDALKYFDNLKIANPVESKDWDEHFAISQKPFESFVMDYSDWLINLEIKNLNSSNDSDKKQAINSLFAIIKNSIDPIKVESTIKKLSLMTGISLETLNKVFSQTPTYSRPEQQKTTSPTPIIENDSFSTKDIKIMQLALSNSKYIIELQKVAEYFANPVLQLTIETLNDNITEPFIETIKTFENNKELFVLLTRLVTSTKLAEYSQKKAKDYLGMILDDYLKLTKDKNLLKMKKASNNEEKLAIRSEGFKQVAELSTKFSAIIASVNN